ncbi:MAG TPA: ABC transporter permease [Thermoanaerobaculia bacterium]|nr:ABC transporter permease [Thermoanaerobaculia bacterium]
MRKILAIARKELIQASRDPLSLGMLLGVPTMMLLLYGYALNFDVRHVSLAVEDRDRTASSRALINSFTTSTYFDEVADIPEGTDLVALTRKQVAKAVLVIPVGYERELREQRTARIQLIVDGADANTAATLLGYASGVVQQTNAGLARQGGAIALTTLPVDFEPRVLYNPQLESTQFLVPGLIAFILMITAVLSTSLSVVREKERGTMEQLRVTALRPIELMLGKLLPYLLISLVATAIIIIAARVLFDVVVKGSYFSLFVATFVYLVGALGWGLLVSSISRSQAMAFQVGVVSSMLPAIFLSGFIFPIQSMPPVLQAITYGVPARYFLVVLRGVILKGAGLAPYTADMTFLAIYALVVMAIAYAMLFRKEA